jgi:hypothetical protein
MKAALQQAIDAMVGADQIDTDMRDAIVACREALKKEPVAWIAKQEDGGLLLWDSSYKLIQEGYDLGLNKRLQYYPLYLGKS